jgi:hypothetical protein
MSFRRAVAPHTTLTGKALTRAMAGIGMNFATTPAADPNIEDTILHGSIEGLEHEDLRTLSVLTSWLAVHARWVNADRLFRLATQLDAQRTRAFWSGVGGWLQSDRRFARFRALHQGPAVELAHVGNAYRIERRGEDPRFRGGPLRVPAGALRDRPQDVTPPHLLAQRHRAYRFRVLIGPTYRADMWALLTAEPGLTPAELARRCYGSFATAHRVKRDFQTLGVLGEDFPLQQATRD